MSAPSPFPPAPLSDTYHCIACSFNNTFSSPSFWSATPTTVPPHPLFVSAQHFPTLLTQRPASQCWSWSCGSVSIMNNLLPVQQAIPHAAQEPWPRFFLKFTIFCIFTWTSIILFAVVKYYLVDCTESQIDFTAATVGLRCVTLFRAVCIGNSIPLSASQSSIA